MKDKVVKAFGRLFGGVPSVVTRAPGRLEILGNHTDYNEGYVLSVAVDRANFVAAAAVEGTTCRVIDIENDTERMFDVAEVGEPEKGDWANYVKGLVVEFAKRDVRVPAFNAVMASTVPMSAGMSSSAALEISMALVMDKLAGANLPWQELARIGQGCENNYVGANTGLLDQFSSLKGRAGHLVQSDFRSYEVKNVPIPEGTALVVANCMVKHNLTNEYNVLRENCEAVAETLAGLYEGVRTLRDVSMSQLVAAKSKLSADHYNCALHVVGECERVLAGCQALEAGDVVGFGKLMFESQHSSSNYFHNSCEELDILVDVAKTLPGVFGARLSGGGFGGITVHLVEADGAENYARALASAYSERAALQADVMICQAADGAQIIG